MTRAWGEGAGSSVEWVQIFRVPAMDDGDGHSNVHELHATELYNLK